MDEQEQKEENVLIDQTKQVFSSDSNESTVKDRVRNLPDWTEYSQIIAKLDDINFSLSIVICIFFFAVAFHVSSAIN